MVLNDIIGARIICNTLDDIKEIKKMIINHAIFDLIKEDSKKKESGYRAFQTGYKIQGLPKKFLIHFLNNPHPRHSILFQVVYKPGVTLVYFISASANACNLQASYFLIRFPSPSVALA